MKTTLLSLALALCASMAWGGDCIAHPCSSAANFAYDLMGQQDTRPFTWGLAAAQTKQMHFKVPPGYRVRIERVYGDFVSWPRGTPLPDGGDAVVGHAAGMLLSLTNTNWEKTPDPSAHVDDGNDDCFLYVQLASKGEPERAAFDENTRAGGLLAPDGTLDVTAAVWLNTLGLAVHMEATFVAVYRFEEAAGE